MLPCIHSGFKPRPYSNIIGYTLYIETIYIVVAITLSIINHTHNVQSLKFPPYLSSQGNNHPTCKNDDVYICIGGKT